MNQTVKNILILIGAAIVGGLVNMGIIMVSGSIIPPPAGVDPSDMESIKANIHLYEAKHFIFPFLAHALGTLAGAFIAAKYTSESRMMWALVVGAFFLIGGIMAATMIPAPSWFIALDIIAAYIPMAWIGGKLGIK